MAPSRRRAEPREGDGERFGRAPIDPTAFPSPIDFLYAEHERQLSACALLDRLVHNPRHGADAAELEALHRFLVRELPLHVADEEQDLFPMLRRRCPDSDDVEEICELLKREHDTDNTLYGDLIRNLEAVITGHAFDDPSQFMMNAFAFSETQRRHLSWENTVVLPRAVRHLTEEDCAELARRIAERRGASPNFAERPSDRRS